MGALVGRTAELEELDRAVAVGRDGGQVAAALVYGAPGYGKSRLLAWTWMRSRS